jgi:hypothetical protein
LALLLQLWIAPVRGAPTESKSMTDWEEYESVSMIQLIATPQHFEGRKVRVHGFARIRFENCVAYLTRDDMEYGNGKNGIWLSFGRSLKAKGLDGRFVLVFGVFTAKDKGHKGANSGTLEDIARIDEWSVRPHRR